MKKLMLTAALLGLTATAASATDQDITLNASVDKFCTIGGSLTPTALTRNIATTTTGGVVTTAINVDIGNVVCNTASTTTLSSAKGGLFDPAVATAVTNFQNYINYSASVSAPVSASVNANGTSVAGISGTGVASSGATSDTGVQVTITPTPNALPIMAGTNYTDTLKVSIVPN